MDWTKLSSGDQGVLADLVKKSSGQIIDLCENDFKLLVMMTNIRPEHSIPYMVLVLVTLLDNIMKMDTYRKNPEFQQLMAEQFKAMIERNR